VIAAAGASLAAGCTGRKPSPPDAAPACVPSQVPGIPAPRGDDETSVELRQHLAWFGALAACTAATRSAASNIPPEDLQAAIQRKQRVTFAGHLESGIATGGLGYVGRPGSDCYVVTVSWDLVLCTGKRFHLEQAPEQPRGPTRGLSCTRRLLAGWPSNIIVSGRLTDGWTIADATLCRP
jgi:hypothetical protein